MELWSAEWVLIKGRFEKDWGVLVDERGVIQSIGPRQRLVSQARAANHYPGRLMLPSIVNPHHHGFHRLFRGAADFAAPYRDLVDNVFWPLSHGVDDELFDAAMRIALAEQALSGVGAVGEFHYLHNGAFETPGQAQFARKIIEIAVELGLRLTLVYSFFDQGSTEARPFIQPLDVSLAEFHALHKEYKDHPLVHLAPGVHSLNHTSPEAIIAASELAERYDLKLHIQLAERQEELEAARTQFGATPLRALEKMSVLSERLVVVSGALLDRDELALMKECGARVVVCPSAAMARGEGCPKVLGLLDEGVPFAVGSDGVILNHHYSAAEDIKLLEFSTRGSIDSMGALESRVKLESLWDLATRESARALGVNDTPLMPGAPADFMVVRIAQPCSRPQFDSSGRHLLNQLIFGWGAQVAATHVMTQGRLIVRNGVMTNVDLTESYRILGRWSEAFLQKVEKSAAKAGTRE